MSKSKSLSSKLLANGRLPQMQNQNGDIRKPIIVSVNYFIYLLYFFRCLCTPFVSLFTFVGAVIYWHRFSMYAT